MEVKMEKLCVTSPERPGVALPDLQQIESVDLQLVSPSARWSPSQPRCSLCRGRTRTSAQIKKYQD